MSHTSVFENFWDDFFLTARREQFYFMDSEEDTEPRKFFCFDGCMIKMDKNVLEVETKELMNGSVPSATYKFMADGKPLISLKLCGDPRQTDTISVFVTDAQTAMDWYEASLKASSRRN